MKQRGWGVVAIYETKVIKLKYTIWDWDISFGQIFYHSIDRACYKLFLQKLLFSFVNLLVIKQRKENPELSKARPKPDLSFSFAQSTFGISAVDLSSTQYHEFPSFFPFCCVIKKG